MFNELANGIALAIYNKYKTMKVKEDMDKAREDELPLKKSKNALTVPSRSEKSRTKGHDDGASHRSKSKNREPESRQTETSKSKKKKTTKEPATKKGTTTKKTGTKKAKTNNSSKGDTKNNKGKDDGFDEGRVSVNVNISGGKGKVSLAD